MYKNIKWSSNNLTRSTLGGGRLSCDVCVRTDHINITVAILAPRDAHQASPKLTTQISPRPHATLRRICEMVSSADQRKCALRSVLCAGVFLGAAAAGESWILSTTDGQMKPDSRGPRSPHKTPHKQKGKIQKKHGFLVFCMERADPHTLSCVVSWILT